MEKQITELKKNLQAMQFLIQNEPHEVLLDTLPAYIELSQRVLEKMEEARKALELSP